MNCKISIIYFTNDRFWHKTSVLYCYLGMNSYDINNPQTHTTSHKIFQH